VQEQSQLLAADSREEMFREFHAGHLKRQTQAIETIKNILVVWVVLTVLGAIMLVAAASRGY
jgi:CHASE3 domain sensor protein